MPTTFFTSDLHFSHKNIMKFCPQFRPYASIKDMDAALIAQWNATVAPDVDEMNEALIRYWNETVQPEDIVYNLGDLSFARDVASIARLLHQLNGEHHLILGNHDEVIGKNRDYFLHTAKADGRPLLASIAQYRQITCDGCSQPLVLFHYPIQEWDGCGKGRYHLYGHVHDRLAPLPGRLLNVGYDLHGRLLKAHDIETYLRDLPALVHHDGQNTFRPADPADARAQITAALRRLNG